MPGWHDASTELRNRTGMETLGVVVEQHPDRARLFMQWKQMGWPLLWDPFNSLELPAVPYTLILDPAGVIRLLNPLIDRLDAVGNYLTGSPAVPDARVLSSPVPTPAHLDPPEGDDAAAWSAHAVALALWGGGDRIDDAVGAAERSVLAPGAANNAWFRKGVISRMRHDSPRRNDGDFSMAADAWAEALRRDPNNYIWRRRLQQYGPRLAKPYSFYDWVPLARADIEARGEVPSPLVVEPGGAEFATPVGADEPAATSDDAAHPDPDGLIVRDDAASGSVPMVTVDVVRVPPAAPTGDGVMVHVEMVPVAERTAHWNNEAGPGTIWVDVPDGWSVTPRLQDLPDAAQATSDERRHVEFEVRIAPDAAPGPHVVEAAVFYYVCDDDTGTCLYRRRDIPIEISVTEGSAGLHD